RHPELLQPQEYKRFCGIVQRQNQKLQNAAQGSEGQVVFPVQIIETFCLIPQVLYLIQKTPEIKISRV
ncbi:hypothetical protein ACM44_04775, partial [Chryseobacterium koreense CCUG 49689]